MRREVSNNMKDKENINIGKKSTAWHESTKIIFKVAIMTGIIFNLFVNMAVATNFGDVIGTYNGVDAKSNGPCTGLYNGTYENTNCELRQNWTYQCIEYVKRFYKDIMGMDTSRWGGNADTYYATAYAKGLDAYPNGGETPPQINDILAFSGGPYGHVAIITDVNSTYVKLIEQNFDRDTAYVTLQRNGNTIQDHITSTGVTYTVQGWLRKNGKKQTPDFGILVCTSILLFVVFLRHKMNNLGR